MTLFPRTPRFPPEKTSEVPSPGRYNPQLHDPSQDPWRKGPIDIFKAPRFKEKDPGPDTFGLYNPDDNHDVHSSRPRPRAVSTLATPSKHHKELLRLETKLSERESNITHLTETLHKSEQNSKEIRSALNRSENEKKALQSEVERLKHQFQGIAGLHTKLIELETEHDKSTKRRDKDISNLKSELRLAEDRASKYLNENKILQGDLERVQSTKADSDQLLRSTIRKTTLQLSEYLQKVFEERHKNRQASQLSQALSLLDNVHNRKLLADRASQVTELVALVNDASSREDLLYDTLDSLLETFDLQMEQFVELQIDLQSERDELRSSLAESKAEITTRQQISDQALCEKDEEIQVSHQLISRTKAELDETKSVCSSLEKTLKDSSEAFNNLSILCRSKCEDLDNCRNDLVMRDNNITELTESIQALNSQIIALNDQIRTSQESHLLATEAWELKQSELQSNLKRLEKELVDEKTKRNKLSGELMLTRQAEAALHGEVEHAQNLREQLEEMERENEKLKRMNDLLMRQSNLNAAEIEKVERLNIELVSQQNPAQKVKVLDRMRKEIKEEKENNAKLKNQLWVADSEIRSLKDELSAYQSISTPIGTSTVQGGKGISRVIREPLAEVVKRFENRSNLSANETDDKETKSDEQLKIKTNKKVQSQHSLTQEDLLPNDIVAPKAKVIKPTTTRTTASRLPINQHQLFRKKNHEPGIGKLNKNQVEPIEQTSPNNPEVSLGAIKMQGKMTLEELR